MNWVAELEEEGFVTDARLEPCPGEDDHSHRIILDFNEPVRDGNDISHLNLSVGGQVVTQHQLYSGDMGHTLLLTPADGDLEIITVGEDDHVVSSDTIHLKQVSMEQADEIYSD